MLHHPARSRRFASTALAVVALGGAVAGCNLVLGLDAYKNCPQDPGCPGTGAGGSGSGPTCTDGEKNGNETDIDCGGSSCPRCADGKACDVGSDCAGGTCSDGKCHTPTCTDGEKNGNETDIDCGGPACARCADDKGCNNGSDCTSKVCTGGTCVAPACSDMLQNGDETDTDCGGATCGKCDVGKGCAADADCKGGSCGADMKCAATCTDGVKDGDETDTDCGGATCPKCALTQGCATGPDCETGVCEGGACVDYFVWAKRFGDSNSQVGSAVAVDGINNVFLSSQVKGTVDFGGGPLTSSMGQAITLTKLDSSGAHVWSKIFTNGQLNRTEAMTTDVAGRVLLTGVAANGADFGGGPLVGVTGPSNFFVAKFDTGGNHLWSKLLTGGRGKAVATSNNGTFVVAGEPFASSANMGCGSLPWSGGSDIIIAAMSGNSNGCLWSKRFGSAATVTSYVQAIAVDAANNTIVGGTFSGTLDFGCGPVASATAGIGSVYIAKLDDTGACVWSKAFGDPANGDTSDPELVGVGVDSSGNILAGGFFAGALDPGTGVVSASGQYDVFAWRLSASGSTTWFRHFGNAPNGYNQPLGFATNTAGKVLLTGNVSSGIDFGAGPLAGGAFVAELDGAGNHLWSRTFGPDLAYGRSVAFSGTNNIVLTGWMTGQLDLGGGPLTTMGSEDVLLAKLLVP